MIHITSEELRVLARAARLNLPDNAQERLVNKLEAVLSYAGLLAHVQQPGINTQEQPQLLRMRDDVSIAPIPTQLLALAPQTEANYFIVPVVIASGSK